MIHARTLIQARNAEAVVPSPANPASASLAVVVVRVVVAVVVVVTMAVVVRTLTGPFSGLSTARLPQVPATA